MGNTRKAKDDLSWTELLSESMAEPFEKPGPDWKTTEMIAEETGKSISHASWQIRTAMRSGKLEKQKFLIDTGIKPYPVPHYRIIK